MKKRLSLLAALLPVLLLATGCPTWEHNPQPYLVVTGTYVLNGGGPGADASLVNYVYQSKDQQPDLFRTANNKSLGASAEDMLCVNGCFYICATADKVLYKTDSLGRIQTEIVTPGTPLSPRHITSYKDHLFVTYAEGFVAKIDTATSAIQILEVGGQPNGIAAANDKIYIALSGATSTTLAVVETRTFAALPSLTVAANPRKLLTVSDQVIYLLSDGDGASVQPLLQVIDPKKDEVYSASSLRNPIDIAAVPGQIIFVLLSVDASHFQIRPLEAYSGAAYQENILSSDVQVEHPVSLSADPANGFVFLGETDSDGKGVVKVFNYKGDYLDTFHSGDSAPAGAYFSTIVEYL